MKTNELKIMPIDNRNNVDVFWDCIKDEPVIDSMKKEDWVGEFIYEIHYKNKLVGFIAYSKWDEACCLSCIYVFEPYRRLGIASAAIRKISYMTKDYEFFYGFVHKDNPAVKLYQKLGFKFLDKNRIGYILNVPTDDTALVQNNFYEFGVKNN